MKFSFIPVAMILSGFMSTALYSMDTRDYNVQDFCIASLLPQEQINEDVLMRLFWEKGINPDKIKPYIGLIFSCLQQLKSIGSADFLVSQGNDHDVHSQIQAIFKNVYGKQDESTLENRIQNIFALLHKRISTTIPEEPKSKKQETEKPMPDSTLVVWEETVIQEGMAPGILEAQSILDDKKVQTPAEYLQQLQGFTDVPTSSIGPKRLKCNYCSETFTFFGKCPEKSMVKHIAMCNPEHYKQLVMQHAIADGILKCKLCQTLCTSISNLVQHVKETELGQKPHKCPQCNEAFSRPGQLKKHISGHRQILQQAPQNQQPMLIAVQHLLAPIHLPVQETQPNAQPHSTQTTSISSMK